VNPQLNRLHLYAVAGLIAAAASYSHGQSAAAPEGTSAIPDPVTLFKDVQTHQAKMDALRENYTFRENTRTETLDSGGSVKGTTVEESEVFFANGYRIARLVKKNGVELSPQAQAREQARVTKLVETDIKLPSGGSETRRIGIVGEILSMAKISNPRRIIFRGRQTLVFDFAGDPHASSHTREESAAKKVAGTLWIDEADRQVARMEARFYDNFRIGGGLLVNVQKGTGVEVDQSPLGDGLWMQTASEQHVAARLVVVNYRLRIHIQDFDFRKFDIGTGQKIQAPKHQE
jgi:hypothetical protein